MALQHPLQLLCPDLKPGPAGFWSQTRFSPLRLQEGSESCDRPSSPCLHPLTQCTSKSSWKGVGCLAGQTLFFTGATSIPDLILWGQSEHFCPWWAGSQARMAMQEAGLFLRQKPAVDSPCGSSKLSPGVHTPFSNSSVLFYLAAYLRLNTSRSFKLLYFLKERQVETVTGVAKSLDFDLNIYLLRLMLSVSPGCTEEDK